MLVREMIEKLQVLPPNTNIKIHDKKGFKSDFKIENGKIILPINITGYEMIKDIKPITNENNTFLNDVTMVCDMLQMSKTDFLNKYFYITSLQYDLTKDLFYIDKTKYIQDLYNKMIEIDIEHVKTQTKFLEQEILKINNIKKQNKMLDFKIF